MLLRACPTLENPVAFAEPVAETIIIAYREYNKKYLTVCKC